MVTDNNLKFGSGIGDNTINTNGHFIVVTKNQESTIANLRSSRVRYIIKEDFKNFGFLTLTTPAGLVELINDPFTEIIEPESEFTTNQNSCSIPWGIDRIDKDGKVDCAFDTGELDGDESHIFIIDTGILKNHEEFQGRLGEGINVFSSDENDWNDCNGHGTHVASSAAGTKYGIAKKSILHSVRVFGCSGGTGTSTIIKGMLWVIDFVKKKSLTNIIVSMSLGGGNSESMKRAVKKLSDKKIIVVVAAGNSNNDACLYSPANSPDAITVGSTELGDKRSHFSNFGNCVDIFAPGSNIFGAWIPNKDSKISISGTSMATPHVSGVIALLSDMTSVINKDDVLKQLVDLSDKGRISDSQTNSNFLLRTPYFKNTQPPSNSPTLSPNKVPENNPNNEFQLWQVITLILLVLFLLGLCYCICNSFRSNMTNNRNIQAIRPTQEV